MTVEEFERAALFYDRTLMLEPHAVDALLGKARAQTSGRASTPSRPSICCSRALVRRRRALLARAQRKARTQRRRVDRHQLAAKLLVNAEVPKLAGLIMRRHALDVSRAKFDESRNRSRDCKGGYYLGVVLAEQRVWRRTAEVLRQASDCRGAELAYTKEIQTSASRIRPSGRRRSPSRRENRQGRRYLATSWFVAVAYA
jgi:hypothetical protein